MNQRNVCTVGLAAVAAVLAGCAAQYQNSRSCVAEMYSRLDGTSLGELRVMHRAVSYRGQRVVIEGQLRRAAAPAGASAAAENHAAGAAASTQAAGAAKPAAAASAPAPAHPTTPVGKLAAHFTHPHPTTPTAAECTFDESGLTSFRWLAPAVLAKTTPAPAHTD